MSLFTIKWTATAIQSIEDIYLFLAEKSPIAAERIAEEIFNRPEQLKKFPESAQQEESLKFLKKGHRYLVISNYKIIYTRKENIIFIELVFDTQQDPKKLIRKLQK